MQDVIEDAARVNGRTISGRAYTRDLPGLSPLPAGVEPAFVVVVAFAHGSNARLSKLIEFDPATRKRLAEEDEALARKLGQFDKDGNPKLFKPVKWDMVNVGFADLEDLAGFIRLMHERPKDYENACFINGETIIDEAIVRDVRRTKNDKTTSFGVDRASIREVPTRVVFFDFDTPKGAEHLAFIPGIYEANRDDLFDHMSPAAAEAFVRGALAPFPAFAGADLVIYATGSHGPTSRRPFKGPRFRAVALLDKPLYLQSGPHGPGVSAMLQHQFAVARFAAEINDGRPLAQWIDPATLRTPQEIFAGVRLQLKGEAIRDPFKHLRGFVSKGSTRFAEVTFDMLEEAEAASEAGKVEVVERRTGKVVEREFEVEDGIPTFKTLEEALAAIGDHDDGLGFHHGIRAAAKAIHRTAPFDDAAAGPHVEAGTERIHARMREIEDAARAAGRWSDWNDRFRDIGRTVSEVWKWREDNAPRRRRRDQAEGQEEALPPLVTRTADAAFAIARDALVDAATQARNHAAAVAHLIETARPGATVGQITEALDRLDANPRPLPLAIKATVGAGKSKATHALAPAPGRRFARLYPTHRLAEEQVEALRDEGQRVGIYQGFERACLLITENGYTHLLELIAAKAKTETLCACCNRQEECPFFNQSFDDVDVVAFAGYATLTHPTPPAAKVSRAVVDAKAIVEACGDLPSEGDTGELALDIALRLAEHEHHGRLGAGQFDMVIVDETSAPAMMYAAPSKETKAEPSDDDEEGERGDDDLGGFLLDHDTLDTLEALKVPDRLEKAAPGETAEERQKRENARDAMAANLAKLRDIVKDIRRLLIAETGEEVWTPQPIPHRWGALASVAPSCFDPPTRDEIERAIGGKRPKGIKEKVERNRLLTVLEILGRLANVADRGCLRTEGGEKPRLRFGGRRPLHPDWTAGGLVFLDATLEPEALRLWTGRKLHVVEATSADAPEIEREFMEGPATYAEHRAAVDLKSGRFAGHLNRDGSQGKAKASAKANRDNIGRRLALMLDYFAAQPVADVWSIGEPSERGKVAVVAPAFMEPAIRALGNPNVVTGHWGAIRGLNAFEDADTLIMISRPQPSTQWIDWTAACMFGAPDYVGAAKLMKRTAKAHVRRRVEGEDGSVAWTADVMEGETVDFPDPRGLMVWRMVTEAEVIQADGRVRATRRAGGGRLVRIIHLTGFVVPELVYTDRGRQRLAAFNPDAITGQVVRLLLERGRLGSWSEIAATLGIDRVQLKSDARQRMVDGMKLAAFREIARAIPDRTGGAE